MKPVRHPSNTRELGAPAGWDQSGLPVEPLGITDTVIGGVPCVLSFWQPDAVDLANIAAGRPVGLSIVGRTMPPAALVTFDPEPGEPAHDPLDWPLPCDVTVGHGTMRKGVKLRSLVLRMESLYAMATGQDAKEVATRPLVLREILAERLRQDVKWGGPAHDDEHTLHDWRAYINKQMSKMHGWNGQGARPYLVKIAALAVAAIESIDRKAGGAE